LWGHFRDASPTPSTLRVRKTRRSPDPTAGIGKPEPLRHLLAGTWSRRFTEEHRLVYLVDGEDLVILQAKYHHK